MESLLEAIRFSARQNARKPALLLADGASVTYGELLRAIEAGAVRLKRLGLSEGEPTLILMQHSPQFIVQMLAVMLAGGIAVLVNPSFGPAELTRISKAAGAQRWLVSNSLLLRVAEQIPSALILHSQSDASVREEQEKEAFLQVKVAAGETLALLFTTGTTGQPKASPLTNAGFLYVLKKCEHLIPYPESHIFSCFLPLFHVFGLTFNLLAPLYFGATISLSELFSPPRVTEILTQLIRYRVSLITAVPLIYQAMAVALERSGLKLPASTICINGGDYLSPSIFEFFRRRTGIAIRPGYGLTETHSLVSVRALDQPYDESLPTACVGQPILPTRIIKLRDYEGSASQEWQECAVGQEGEICFSTSAANVIRSYIGDERANAFCFQGGWFASGDVGRLDTQGNLYVVDRVKDIIIVGGCNIYPREIEDVLESHPKINQAACIGVPDPDRGERIRAYVVLKSGETASPFEIRSFVRDRLSPLKVPYEVEFRASLPMLGVKVNKVLLKKEIRKEGLWRAR